MAAGFDVYGRRLMRSLGPPYRIGASATAASEGCETGIYSSKGANLTAAANAP